jgi:hypothetical protein
MQDWQAAGLNVATAVKRGIFTIHQDLIIRSRFGFFRGC